MNDQATAVETSPLDRMMSFVENDEIGGKIPDDEEQDETLQAEEQPQVEDDAVEEPLEEITHNGELKKLTKTELKELAQKGFDYTSKTQQIAEERKHLEDQKRYASEQSQFQNSFIAQIAEAKAIESQLAQFKQVNWQQLAADDPMQYLSLNQTHQDLKEQYNSKVNEINELHGKAQQTHSQQKAELLQREAQAMMQAIPEWKDSAKASAEMSEMKQYLAKSGFGQHEVEAIFDHRQVTVARKAMLYDKLMTTGQKKVQAAPPAARPGGKQQPQNAQHNELRQRLKKTGSGDFAAKLIENMI